MVQQPARTVELVGSWLNKARFGRDLTKTCKTERNGDQLGEFWQLQARHDDEEREQQSKVVGTAEMGPQGMERRSSSLIAAR